MRDESRLRFESLRHDGLSVTEYEVRFCQLSRHALAIIPNETERIRRFVRGLTFSIRSAVFRASREGGFFPVHCERLQRGGIDGERGVWGP